MKLAQALIEVSKGKKVSCPLWKSEGNHISLGTKGGVPVYWNGRWYEPIAAQTLAMWITQDSDDWYVL